MTSVGSGSLIIIALMALYPTLKASELVGTDLVQAVPLVAAAAIGHLLFGDFQLDLTTSLLLGCIPGVWIGAHLSAARTRRVWCAGRWRSCCWPPPSSCSTSPTPTPASSCCWSLLIAPVLWMLVRRRHGFPAIAPRRPKTEP